MYLQVRLPIRQRGLTKLTINFMHELWFRNVELCRSNAGGGKVPVPVERRSLFLQAGKACLVVGVGGIAKGDVVQRVICQAFLERKNHFGGCFRAGVVVTDQLEHIGHMRHVLFARLLKPWLGFQIVIAIRQSESPCLDVGDSERGIVVVGR